MELTAAAIDDREANIKAIRLIGRAIDKCTFKTQLQPLSSLDPNQGMREQAFLSSVKDFISLRRLTFWFK